MFTGLGVANNFFKRTAFSVATLWLRADCGEAMRRDYVVRICGGIGDEDLRRDQWGESAIKLCGGIGGEDLRRKVIGKKVLHRQSHGCRSQPRGLP